MTFKELRSFYSLLHVNYDTKKISKQEFIESLKNIDFSLVEFNEHLENYKKIIKNKIESLEL